MIKIKKNKNKPSFFSLAKLKKILNTNPGSSSTRQKIIICGLFIFFTLIIIKLINLQVFQHSDQDQFVNSMAYKESEELQQRGFIFDRNKDTLAMSVKTYTIALDSKMMPDIDAVKQLLSKYDINLSSSNYNSIKSGKRHIEIKKNISELTILKLKQDISAERKKIRERARQLNKDLKLYKKDPQKKEEIRSELNSIKEDKFVCIKIQGNYKRVYPEKELAAHVIGKVNSENVGTNGIERTCNEQLSGENIKRQKMVINNYKSVYLDSLEDEDIEQSNNVTLTIDRKLQFIAEDELEKGLIRTKTKRGVAIIQNPHNGEILAMASLPTYNPEEKVAKQEYLHNNAISLAAEPGSTFKVVILSTVLDRGIFKLTDKVYCENGNFKIFGATIHDHDKQRKGTGTHQHFRKRRYRKSQGASVSRLYPA